MKKSGKKSIFKVINVIKNILCWALVFCLTVTVIGLFVSRISGNVPTLMGYSIYRVASGSMEPELMTGDIILSREVADPSELKVGDVITFAGSGEYEGKLVTHEVIRAVYTNENGSLMLQTKGVANEISDDPIYADSVISVMVCKLTFLNSLYELFLSPWGLLIFIALIVLIFFDEVVRFVKILSGNEKSVEDGEDINEIIERLQREKNTQDAEKEDNEE